MNSADRRRPSVVIAACCAEDPDSWCAHAVHADASAVVDKPPRSLPIAARNAWSIASGVGAGGRPGPAAGEALVVAVLFEVRSLIGGS
jgi:hypothetical protein